MAGKIAYNPTLKDATITIATAEAVTYGKVNLFSNSPTAKCRTTGISSQSILVDHGTSTNIKAVYFERSNIVSGDTTCTIQAGNSAPYNTYGPVNLTKGPKAYLEIDQTYRYFQHIVTKASGSYVEWGKFELFEEVDEFTKNYQYDRTTGTKEIFRRNVGPNGNIVNEFMYQAQVRTWTFLDITQAQADLFKLTYGILESCVIYDDFDSTAYYGVIDMSTLQGNRTGRYDLIFRFTEKR